MCTHVVGTDFRFTGRLGGVSACPLPTNNIQREGGTVRPGRVQCSARRRSLLYGEREMACPQNVFALTHKKNLSTSDDSLNTQRGWGEEEGRW